MFINEQRSNRGLELGPNADGAACDIATSSEIGPQGLWGWNQIIQRDMTFPCKRPAPRLVHETALVLRTGPFTFMSNANDTTNQYLTQAVSDSVRPNGSDRLQCIAQTKQKWRPMNKADLA
ncbi:hypothetical protein RRG08_040171 [Elysia crispata]|uniref:Uncharacterized protein n=1 Tax=Elysia crispata TaxID=231223 RepID=A0AAE1CN49_9GAST|nr:hypothetical protein RRG08_040171 [Elysia crispata]